VRIFVIRAGNSGGVRRTVGKTDKSKDKAKKPRGKKQESSSEEENSGDDECEATDERKENKPKGNDNVDRLSVTKEKLDRQMAYTKGLGVGSVPELSRMVEDCAALIGSEAGFGVMMSRLSSEQLKDLAEFNLGTGENTRHVALIGKFLSASYFHKKEVDTCENITKAAGAVKDLLADTIAYCYMQAYYVKASGKVAHSGFRRSILDLLSSGGAPRSSGGIARFFQRG
jgi:hypothetical protein